MSLDQELQTISAQEAALQWRAFNADTAWAVGSRLRDDALRRNAAMTFEIQIAGQILFCATTPGAQPGQADWIRRKRNVVMRFGHSSLKAGLLLEREGKTLAERHGLALADYAMHGGGFPVILLGTGCVGSVIASGLHQRVDHRMVAEALAAVLGVSVPHLDDPD